VATTLGEHVDAGMSGETIFDGRAVVASNATLKLSDYSTVIFDVLGCAVASTTQQLLAALARFIFISCACSSWRRECQP